MEERDLRRSPSFERLLKRRPSFSRPPIRTLYSPRLTEDEAEMLTSPYLSYRTRYTYAQSSCYDPQLPCAWEVPNLANTGEEYDYTQHYTIHASAPGFLYVLWSYVKWTFELITYFAKKIFITPFTKGPTALLVLLYDIICYLFYGCRSIVSTCWSSIRSFFFGSASLYKSYSVFEILYKVGYFVISLLLLPVSAAYWLLDSTGRGALSVFHKMKESVTPRRNVRPYLPRSAKNGDHVHFSPKIATYDENEEHQIPGTPQKYQDDTEVMRTASKRRTIHTVHNLRSRIVTGAITDSEDEGFSERRPSFGQETPIKSVLKSSTHARRKLYPGEEGKPSVAGKIAQLLGRTASTFVSGVYWVLISLLTLLSRVIHTFKQRAWNMLSRNPQNSNVKAVHIRRSTRRRNSSNDDVHDYPSSHPIHDQSWSSKFTTTILYPLAVAFDFISSAIVWLAKVALAIIFAIVDFVRYIKNLVLDGLVYLYGRVKQALFGGTHMIVEGFEGENVDKVDGRSLLRKTGDFALATMYVPYEVLNWLGMKTIDTLNTLGDKKRLALWLLPLFLLLLILLAKSGEEPKPTGIRANVEEIQRAVKDRVEHMGDTVGDYYDKAKETTKEFKEDVTEYFDNKVARIWSMITEAPSNLASGTYNSLNRTVRTAWHIYTKIWRTLRDVVQSVFSGTWDFFSTVFTATKNSFITGYNSARSGPSGVKKLLTSLSTNVRNFVYDVFSRTWNLISSIISATWNAVKAGPNGLWNISTMIVTTIRDFIYAILTTVWNGLVKIRFNVHNGLINIFNFIENILTETFGRAWKAIKNFVSFVSNNVTNLFSSLYNLGKYFVSLVWNSVKSFISLIYQMIMFLWNRFVDFLVYLIDVWRSFSTKVASLIPRNVSLSLPNTEEIKQAVLEKVPDIPELPLQFYPSHYKEYVPSTEQVSSSVWSIIKSPINFWNYIKPVILDTQTINVVPAPKPDDLIKHNTAYKEPVIRPPPKVVTAKVDEEKIVQAVLARLSMPNEAKVVHEVTKGLEVPKVDEDRIIKEVTDRLHHEMELRMKAIEQSYKKNIQELNIKRTNVEIDYTQLEALIRKAIYQYDADKTGLFDFALESAGAAVISTRCSENYNTYSRLEKIWNIPLWYSSYGPRTVIQRNSNSLFPGECWSFKGGNGYLTIDLSHKINISSISYEHIGADQAPDNNRNSAPKLFKFWAYKTEDDIAGRFLLGDFEYKLDGHPLQFFVIKEQPNFPVKIVEMEVTSNYGAEFTCLYRLRVHGQVYRAP